MKLQILPNWCKKLGFFIFMIGALISFFEGLYSSLDSSIHPNHNGCIYNYIHFFSLLEIIGMMIYMMSKEKIEDDYISALRLESYQLTFFINIIIALLFFVFKKEMNIEFDLYLSTFLLIYLSIFAVKKRMH